VKTLTDDAWTRLQQIRAERDPNSLFVDYLAGPGGFRNPPKVDASGKNAEMTAMVLRADRSIGLERRPVPTLRDGVGVVIVVVWEGRIKNHLEAYWEDVPIEHITIDAVNEWAWK
jgi:hypothetical protein